MPPSPVHRLFLGLVLAVAFVPAGAAEPARPAADFLVTDHGAVGDGATTNTAAIQKAVDACAAAGGGRVVVPAGVFVSGPIFLKSHVEFHLVAGAVLRGSPTIADYPLLDCQARGYHIDRWWHASLLTGTNLENVAITGRGTIDGRGEVWWKAKEAGQLKFIRPMTVFLFDCERVRVDGVRVMDSPSWTTVSILCRNMTFHDLTIRNPFKPYHNCDGINFVSCRNVRISNCSIDTGDDGITLKSLPDFGMVTGDMVKKGDIAVDYSKPRIPCEDFTITNCVVEHAHSGVGIWAEVIGGMRNIVVSNCVFDGTRVGIKIARWPPPGGFMKDIRVSNIVMRRVEVPLEVSSFADPKAIGPGPDRETTPEISNIHISDITATKARVACQAHGLPKMPLRDVSFSRIRIEADRGFEVRDAENILLDDVTVSCPGPAVMARDVKGLEIRRLDAARPQADVPAIELTRCANAWIHGCRMRDGSGPFVGLVGDANAGLVLGDDPLPLTRAEIQPTPTWSSSSYAFTGSCLWRTEGGTNPFLPVPPAVADTIGKHWDRGRIHGIHGIHRLESNARPDVTLPAGDLREIYVVMAWSVPEVLLIAEDGELLRKAENFDYQANFQ